MLLLVVLSVAVLLLLVLTCLIKRE